MIIQLKKKSIKNSHEPYEWLSENYFPESNRLKGKYTVIITGSSESELKWSYSINYLLAYDYNEAFIKDENVAVEFMMRFL